MVPNEHPVKRKLRISIIPPLVVARKLSARGFYIAHVGYTYTNDLAIFLLGAGVLSSDVFGFFEGNAIDTSNVEANLLIPLILLVIAWGLIRIYVIRENTQQKFEFAKKGQQTFQNLEQKLEGILQQIESVKTLDELMKELDELLTNITEARSSLHSVGVWLFPPYPPKYDREISNWLNEICKQHEEYWSRFNISDERME